MIFFFFYVSRVELFFFQRKTYRQERVPATPTPSTAVIMSVFPRHTIYIHTSDGRLEFKRYLLKNQFFRSTTYNTNIVKMNDIILKSDMKV